MAVSASSLPETKHPAVLHKNARAGSRLHAILDEAARLFAQQGYHDTSIRDIVRAIGMLPGSLYCHFASKEDLLLAVYQEGVNHMLHAVSAALEGAGADPWDRLERACIGHLQGLLQGSAYAMVVIRVMPGDVPPVRGRLVELRDRFEAVYAGLIDALPLAAAADRRVLRLTLMGALNWTQFWYRPGGAIDNSSARRDTPAALAKKIVGLLRGNSA